ncbi:MAG TPA: radical SAM protein [Candidatus Eisenbacteria bacterium]|nr:radical SAM protein [Candidatus Eisenbacteria bacterium]
MDRFYKLLQMNRLVHSHRLKFAGLLAMHYLRQRYLCLRFDPVMSCNLRCQMCYFSAPDFVKEHTGRFSWEQVERLAEVFFPWTLQLYIGCGTEPTTYKRFLDIHSLARKHRVPMVGMVSNGQLLTAEHVERLVDERLDELTLSTHGVTRETYERLMTRASFDKFLHLLETLDSIKRRKGLSAPQLRMNYTVNPANLDELSSFFDTYGKVNIRTLQVRPIIDFGTQQYREKLDSYQSRYKGILTQLRKECERRQIRLLANFDDFLYSKRTTQAALHDEITVYIDPETISKAGFDYQHESYLAYCKRTGWSKSIARKMVLSPRRLEAQSTHLSYNVFG